jgi:hypothetical protein
MSMSGTATLTIAAATAAYRASDGTSNGELALKASPGASQATR